MRRNRTHTLARLGWLTGAVALSLTVLWNITVFAETTVADFSGSTKSASVTTASDGATVDYTIVISNSGSSSGNVVFTDTLPSELDYVDASLSVTPGSNTIDNGSGVAGDVVTWTGTIGAGAHLTLTFSSIVTGSPTVNTVVTNTAEIDDGSVQVAVADSFTVVSPTVMASNTILLPALFLPSTPPVLSSTSAAKDGSDYSWTLSWIDAGAPGGTSYVVEESNSMDFINTTVYTTANTSLKITQPRSENSNFYYRVRRDKILSSANSNTINVAGAYYTEFNDQGNWAIVREDFDDTQNELYVTQEGNLKMHVRGRWDYFIASPLVPAPEPPYRIKTRVRLEGPGNLNTYGAVFGADWDGTECPNYQTGTAVSSCFNGYYRNILLWNWGGGTMQSGIKRIFQHSASKNSGQGATLAEFVPVNVSSDSANDWNEWTWEIYPDGTINLYSGSTLVQTVTDPTFVNRPYWGFWASTDEYPGSDPLWDYVLVEPIN